jgi:hypothetical protein
MKSSSKYPPFNLEAARAAHAAAVYDRRGARRYKDFGDRVVEARNLKAAIIDRRMFEHPEWYRDPATMPRTREERVAYARWKLFEHRAGAISSTEPQWRATKARLLKASIEWREQLERLIRNRGFYER